MGETSIGETLCENFVKCMGEKRWEKNVWVKLCVKTLWNVWVRKDGRKVMGENFIKVWVKTL